LYSGCLIIINAIRYLSEIYRW